MRIGIYGGSFDPPHIGHLNIARQAVDLLLLDELLIVPAGYQYFKDQTNVADKDLRVKMCCETFLKYIPNCVVSATEVERDGPSYTYVTVKEYKQKHMKDEIFLIMGCDAFKDFYAWHEALKLTSLVTIAVFSRGISDITDYMTTKANLENYYFKKKIKSLYLSPSFVGDPSFVYDEQNGSLKEQKDLSSTEIRKRIKEREPYEHYLTPYVADIIKENKLYV